MAWEYRAAARCLRCINCGLERTGVVRAVVARRWQMRRNRRCICNRKQTAKVEHVEVRRRCGAHVRVLVNNRHAASGGRRARSGACRSANFRWSSMRPRSDPHRCGGRAPFCARNMVCRCSGLMRAAERAAMAAASTTSSIDDMSLVVAVSRARGLRHGTCGREGKLNSARLKVRKFQKFRQNLIAAPMADTSTQSLDDSLTCIQWLPHITSTGCVDILSTPDSSKRLRSARVGRSQVGGRTGSRASPSRFQGLRCTHAPVKRASSRRNPCPGTAAVPDPRPCHLRAVFDTHLQHDRPRCVASATMDVCRD